MNSEQDQDPAVPPSSSSTQDRTPRTGFSERLFGIKAVAALALGSLILGGAGGAALGAVSAGSDSEQSGRFGGPSNGQPGFGQQGQPGQQGVPGQQGQQGQQGLPGQQGQLPDGTDTDPGTLNS